MHPSSCASRLSPYSGEPGRTASHTRWQLGAHDGFARVWKIELGFALRSRSATRFVARRFTGAPGKLIATSSRHVAATSRSLPLRSPVEASFRRMMNWTSRPEAPPWVKCAGGVRRVSSGRRSCNPCMANGRWRRMFCQPVEEGVAWPRRRSRLGVMRAPAKSGMNSQIRATISPRMARIVAQIACTGARAARMAAHSRG